MTAVTEARDALTAAIDASVADLRMGAFERALTADTDKHVEFTRRMARWEALDIVRAGLAPFVPFRVIDGYADDAEFLSEVVCADCGETREDAKRCDDCGVRDCTVRLLDCAYAGGYPDLCDDCMPSHRGCPECDPPDREDR